MYSETIYITDADWAIAITDLCNTRVRVTCFSHDSVLLHIFRTLFRLLSGFHVRTDQAFYILPERERGRRMTGQRLQ